MTGGKWTKIPPGITGWYWHREEYESADGKIYLRAEARPIFLNSGLYWLQFQGWKNARFLGGKWWTEPIEYPPGIEGIEEKD